MLDVVTFTTLYPNALQQRHGIFVEQRLLQLLRTGEMQAQVVAPVPWFPWGATSFGRYGVYARIPAAEVREGVSIAHPRYPVLPKLGMHVAPALMAMRLLPYLRSLHERVRHPYLLDGHFLYPDGVALAMIGRKLGVPVVLTARGSDVNLYCRFPGPRAMIRWAIMHCSRVITVSEQLRGALMAIGVPASHVVTMPNGVDAELFTPMDRESARRKTGYRGFTMVFVGTLVPLKGHALAIEAVARMPDTRLSIIGEGPCEKSLRRLIAERGVADRVSILPNMLQSDLVAHYSAADALILASRHEGMPNVILESLACGNPVVATAVGGIPDVVNSPDAGVLVRERTTDAFVEAVRYLRRNYPTRSRTRRYGIQYGWQRTVDGVLQIFREVMDENEVMGLRRTPLPKEARE